MQKYIIVFLTLAGLIAAGPAAADDFAHYYTPSGFRLPVMNRGEYILSSDLYHYKVTSSTDDLDTLPRGSRYYHKETQIRLWGAIALTDQFLICADLTYFPPQKGATNEDWVYYTFYLPDSLHFRHQRIDADIDGYFSPAVILAYRPQTNLEFHFCFEISTRETDYSGWPVESWMPKKSVQDQKWIQFGITYQGKL